MVPIDELKPLGRETRRHPKNQIVRIAAIIGECGFVAPVVVDHKRRVVAGRAVIEAAKQLGLGEVPVVTVRDLPYAKLRALRLALNRLTEDASWDAEALRAEFAELLTIDPQIDLQLTGFSTGELDVAMSVSEDLEDKVPPPEAGASVTRLGDLWILGDNRLLCADARQAESYGRLMEGAQARMIFADPPYNVPIAGHASGLGKTKHANFAMAAGEMSDAEFEAFLTELCMRVCEHAIDGSLHYVCMDWRGVSQLLNATRPIYDEQLNLCVWNKPRPGMGSFYRSKHELVFVFKKGRAPHLNNVQLGRNGRNRCNVWDYQNSWAHSPKSKLALHPTVKPVALIVDAIRDCTNEHDIVLDPCGGAGTTLIAAERTRRRARLIEIDPIYVDVTIRRWQHLTGKLAVHAESGEPFGQTRAAKLERAND
ncbi:DNA methylase N-4 [Bradyrhizobium genosp. SA-3]|uniref:site-specific DNA-methyltransferase n=1 Tax=Bradyrhizobium genosp. SA-3 TaxID=508868 RepID=UPI0010299CA8|nr:DNA methyltransferase [Bradyrhizobium genosp. SA-3]RZN08872.1 DNA methylase N-4 [Bradyrhizobium genosp. SA-3]